MEHFKFISPFFKEKTQGVIDSWQSEMDDYVNKVISDMPGLSIADIKFEWLFIKMAQGEAISINEIIADDLKRQQKH